MSDSDIVLVGAVASAILQAVKRYIPTDVYPVVLIVVGALLGGGLGYARQEASGIADGAVMGVTAAFASAGIYSSARSMGIADQPRDAKGRFVKREDATQRTDEHPPVVRRPA